LRAAPGALPSSELSVWRREWYTSRLRDGAVNSGRAGDEGDMGKNGRGQRQCATRQAPHWRVLMGANDSVVEADE